jgi:hypothetical protein
MTALGTAARLAAKAAATLQAEQQRDGGPQPREIRQAAADLYDAAAAAVSAAYDADAGRARGT